MICFDPSDSFQYIQSIIEIAVTNAEISLYV